jgi:hypothetical protein
MTEPPKSLGPPTVILVQRTSDNPVDASNHSTSSVSESFLVQERFTRRRYYNTSEERICGSSYITYFILKHRKSIIITDQ